MGAYAGGHQDNLASWRTQNNAAVWRAFAFCILLVACCWAHGRDLACGGSLTWEHVYRLTGGYAPPRGNTHTTGVSGLLALPMLDTSPIIQAGPIQNAALALPTPNCPPPPSAYRSSSRAYLCYRAHGTRTRGTTCYARHTRVAWAFFFIDTAAPHPRAFFWDVWTLLRTLRRLRMYHKP